jgi:glutamate/tyrosine decarboxylase-like PLP-dependent enzyme
MTDALDRALHHAREWLDGLDSVQVGGTATAGELREALGGPMPETGSDAGDVIDALAIGAGPGLHANAGGRFFAWVMAGSLPSSLAADWLVSAWDQNTGMFAVAPATTIIEEIAGGWLIDLFGLPSECSFAFTTGCQLAHVTALTVARHAVLEQVDWNVGRDGLYGAPPIRILTSSNRHNTLDAAVRYVGMGEAHMESVATGQFGDMLADDLAQKLSGPMRPTILCLNAADLNVGTFDDFKTLIPIAKATGAWVHVDGAFGLFARTSPAYRGLADGIELADSWATDGHKWLNVPYDCGMVFVRDAAAHRAAIAKSAAYLSASEDARDPSDWNFELSRRARAVPIYAALRELGRAGVAELVERCCRHCAQLVSGLGALPGARALNVPVLNQGLVRFGRTGASERENDVFTDEVIRRTNAAGEAFFSGTTWNGVRAMRVSVVSWRTTEHDVSRSIAAVGRALLEAEAAA